MKFTAKFVPYDILLCYNRKICTARSDDNNMATSTVSSYEKLDYNRSCVRAIYPCQMPKNCCVPKCTKKGYIEEGKKISYFKFPQEKHLFDEWIRAICRDVGRHFKVTENTRVCSRHFKDTDFEVSLTGRRTLRDGAAPSRFEWKTTSPKKRKSPTKSRANIQDLDSDSHSDEQAGPSTSHSGVIGAESQEMNALENEVNELKTRVEHLTERCTNSERKVFCFSRFCNDNKSFQFYTGFPDVKVFDALYEFCNPGEYGENISYWHSATTSEGSSDSLTKQGRPRILHPKEELFITLYRLRQGFPEEHLLRGISEHYQQNYYYLGEFSLFEI